MRKNPSVLLLGRNPSFLSPSLLCGSQASPGCGGHGRGDPHPSAELAGGPEAPLLDTWEVHERPENMRVLHIPWGGAPGGAGGSTAHPKPAPAPLWGWSQGGCAASSRAGSTGHGLDAGGTNRQKTRLGLSSVLLLGWSSSETPGAALGTALRWCLGHGAGVWDQEWRTWERQEAAWDLILV